MLPYTTPKATLQQVLLKQRSASSCMHVQKVLQRLRSCRTASLGYHVYRCSEEACGHIKYQYHSCRDRHCPQCGALKKQEWIEARMQELLPVPYFHVVFTLPHELNSVVLGHRILLYKLLFDASAQTVFRFAKDTKWLGALPGIISVLHTWGQQLSFHPHIHCIVSGGGIDEGNAWQPSRRKGAGFLFPVKAMSMGYKGNFLEGLQQHIKNNRVVLPVGVDGKQLLNDMYAKDWVVYAKSPFGGPHAVIEYLGRYTHKVAISNHRISSINEADETVNFAYKDYADGNTQKEMRLPYAEFIRRFEQHILPKRFTKIRTYGYLANRNRHRRINEVLKKLQLPQHKGVVTIPIAVRMQEQYGIILNQCPCCRANTLKLLKVFYPWKQSDDG